VRIFKLIRVSVLLDGTFGVLLDGDVPFALTVERPWLNNQRGVSCIPDGIYQCMRVDSPKFGYTFEVMDVPGRSEILFHKGNILDDTHGCIVVGEQFESLGGKVAVLSSAKGFAEFLWRTRDLVIFEIEVKSVY